jgi:uncharacterized phage protein (TIGR02220 family)
MNEGYAICLNEWALDKDIKNELGLLLIISSLCAEKGFCYASNKYLSELFDISEETISRKLKTLEDKKYITIEYKKRGCEVLERNIRLTKISIDDYQKYQSTIDENVKENNTSNKNINNPPIYPPIEKNQQGDGALAVLEYMNTLGDRQYKPVNATMKLIKARLKEHTVDEMKDVIYHQYQEWCISPKRFSSGKMSDTYFRPSTLFRASKFENYLEDYRRAVKEEENETS